MESNNSSNSNDIKDKNNDNTDKSNLTLEECLVEFEDDGEDETLNAKVEFYNMLNCLFLKNEIPPNKFNPLKDDIFFETKYGITNKQMKLNEIKKKIMLPIDNELPLGEGFILTKELSLSSQLNWIIVDLDSRDKSNQAKLFNSTFMYYLINEFDFYIESTINSGVHIFMPLSDQFSSKKYYIEKYGISNDVFVNEDYSLPSFENIAIKNRVNQNENNLIRKMVIELKKTCITYPTEGYSIKSIPSYDTNPMIIPRGLDRIELCKIFMMIISGFSNTFTLQSEDVRHEISLEYFKCIQDSLFKLGSLFDINFLKQQVNVKRFLNNKSKHQEVAEEEVCSNNINNNNNQDVSLLANRLKNLCDSSNEANAVKPSTSSNADNNYVRKRKINDEYFREMRIKHKNKIRQTESNTDLEDDDHEKMNLDCDDDENSNSSVVSSSSSSSSISSLSDSEETMPKKPRMSQIDKISKILNLNNNNDNNPSTFDDMLIVKPFEEFEDSDYDEDEENNNNTDKKKKAGKTKLSNIELIGVEYYQNNYKNYKQPVIDNVPVSIPDKFNHSSLKKLIITVCANVDACLFDKKFAQRGHLGDNLLNSIFRLYESFTTGSNPLPYGAHLKTFLDWMLLYDKTKNSLWRVQNDSSIFSSLSDTPKWFNFVISYCRLVIFLDRNKVCVGRNNLVSKLNYYKLYRKITILNEVGKNLGPGDEVEFNKMLKLTKEKYMIPSKHDNVLFLQFVLTTLSVININESVINHFEQYVNYVTGSFGSNKQQKEQEFMSIMFKNSLSEFNLGIAYFENNSDRGNALNSYYLCIQRYPWITISNNNPLYNLVATIFPNNSISSFINRLNSQENPLIDHSISRQLNARKGKWKYKFPFENGVFDFSFPNDKGGRSSIFRNYSIYDAVINTIPYSFDINDYIAPFSNISNEESSSSLNISERSEGEGEGYPFLSLDNYERYTKEFCMFMKSVFGCSHNKGEMYAYNYMNLLAFESNLLMGLMRTCNNQNATTIWGCGANGKSQIIKHISEVLGKNLCINVNSSSLFSNREINMQISGLDESMLAYDHEANSVTATKFKEKTGDKNNATERAIFKTISRDTVYSNHYLLGCNNILKCYDQDKIRLNTKLDLAFLRRVFLIQFFNNFNLVGKRKDFNHDYDFDDSSMNTQVEKMNDEFVSLIEKHNFNLNSREFMKNIVKGRLYYMLDLYHVFDFTNLNVNMANFITIPSANKRLVGAANYKILKGLLDKYIVVTEILPSFSVNQSVDPEIPRDSVDLVREIFLMTNDQSELNNLDVKDVFSTLTSHFDFIGEEMTIDNEEESDKSFQVYEDINISEKLKSFNVQCGNKRYIFKNLVLRSRLNEKMSEIASCPHKNLLFKSGKVKQKEINMYSSNKEFVLAGIPMDHRFKFCKDLEPKMFEVIANLIAKKNIKPDQIPKISREYENITIETFIQSITDLCSE